MITVHKKINLTSTKRGRKIQEPKPDQQPEVSYEKIPRISRLMALAIKYQGMLDRGEVSGITELARLCHVTQPRMSQILNLNSLCPRLQERLLIWCPIEHGNDVIHEKSLRKTAALIDWDSQVKQIEIEFPAILSCS